MITCVSRIVLDCDSFFRSDCERGAQFSSRSEARSAGWILSRSGKCFCPSCAPFYRNVGRSGKPRKFIQECFDV